MLENLQAELNTLIKQRSSLFDLLEQGLYTKDLFLERSNQLEERISKCKTDISSTEDELAREIEIKKDRVNFIPKCQKALENWDELTVPEKNTVLKSLVEKIIFTKTERNTKSKQDAYFSIDVFPRVSR